MISLESGKYKIPLISVISILSMSLVVNLPGLAISPVMARLDQIFPHTSDLEIQLLSILPNFFIIPFVLLSGKLSESKSKLTLAFTGLVIYLLSGLIYLFAKNMMTLIIVSCLLGVGCGLVIPIAGGLVADYFYGKYRVRLLGIKSGVAVFTIVVANIFVGGTVDINWHIPFVVYLIPIIPILLFPFISRKYLAKNLIIDNANNVNKTPENTDNNIVTNNIFLKESNKKSMIYKLA